MNVSTYRPDKPITGEPTIVGGINVRCLICNKEFSNIEILAIPLEFDRNNPTVRKFIVLDVNPSQVCECILNILKQYEFGGAPLIVALSQDAMYSN